jgi:hypothetical protein
MRHKITGIICPVEQGDCHQSSEVGAGAQSFMQPELGFNGADSH